VGVGLRGGGGGNGEVPGEDFDDAVNGMIGDAREHVAQIAFRVEAVEFSRADQAVEDSRAFTPSIGTGKEIVLPAQRDGPQSALGSRMPTSELCRQLNRWSRSTDVQA